MQPTADDPDLVAIVAAREAWPLYLRVSAYITQNRRAIRPTLRLGFYARRTIYPSFPLVLSRHDDVDVSDEAAGRLLLSIDPVQQRLGAVVQGALDYGWSQKRLTVFLLTAPDDPRTVTRTEIHHSGVNAWTMGQRYASLAALRAATTTEDLS